MVVIIFFIILSIILSIISSIVIICLLLHTKLLTHIPYKYKKAKTDMLTVVVQTYNSKIEDLDVIYEQLPPGSKLVLLEKGTSQYPSLTSIPMVEIYFLENKGRDMGAFLYYCFTFYDDLKGSYIFTSANLDKHDRKHRFKHLIMLHDVEFHCPSRDCAHLMNRHMFKPVDFTIRSYEGVDLVPANIRPYSKWFIENIGPYSCFLPICFNGIFRTSAERLHSKSRIFYQNLYEQTNIDNNTEVVHFIERAACQIF